MAEVFICEKGQMTQPSKMDLRKAGIVVVEVDDLTKCQFVRAQEVVSTDDMVFACLHALNSQQGSHGSAGHQREQLARNLLAVAEAARRPSKTVEAS